MTVRRVRWAVIGAVAAVLAMLGTGVTGTALAATSSTSTFALHWSSPVAADPIQGHPDAISCASATSCLAGDENGALFRWTGDTWTGLPRWSGGRIVSVSCPTPSFCAASNGGSVEFLESGIWESSGLTTDYPLDTVSCVSSTSCVVASDKWAYEYAGSKWTKTSGYDGAQAMSCPSAGWCVALDSSGDYTVLKDGVWTTPVSVFSDDNSVDPSVSCRTESFCVASVGGQVSEFDGTSWTAPGYIASATAGLEVSCYAVEECVAVGTNGESYRLSSSGWSTGIADTLTASGLSCPTATFCLEFGPSGGSATFNGSAWSKAEIFDPEDTGYISSLSCPSTTFCAAVDLSGFALTFNGKSWSTPEFIDEASMDSGVSLTSVSCLAASFCMAVDGRGRAFTFSGKTWSGPSQTKARSLRVVSCATTKFCVAGSHSAVYVYNGTGWSVGRTGVRVSALSCPTDTLCEGVNGSGSVWSYQGKSWTRARIDGVDPYVYGVSCWTAKSCTAVDGAGEAIHFDGVTWSKPVHVDQDNSLAAISCASTTRCVATDINGDVVRLYREKRVQRQNIAASESLAAISCATPRFCVAVVAETEVRLGT